MTKICEVDIRHGQYAVYPIDTVVIIDRVGLIGLTSLVSLSATRTDLLCDAG